MGYKENDPCLQKAHKDERLFVLMTRDSEAPKSVLEWIKNSIYSQSEEKLREAFECAMEMRNRCSEFHERKKFEKEGWIFVQKELPCAESTCDVLFEDSTEGALTYWNDHEGWDAQTEPHHIGVIAWKNPRRAV